MREYAPLTHQPLPPGARLAEPSPPGRVSLDDPALSVMTDLRDVRAVTITPEETADQAHASMVRRGLRLLFVLDRERAVTGVITATDLLGEKPVRFMQERRVTHADILVRDLMTGATQIETLAFAEVAQMRVGHVVATLKAVRRQHLMVSEDGGRRIRGLFSATQVARQLGVQLQTFEIARTFAEVEAALGR